MVAWQRQRGSHATKKAMAERERENGISLFVNYGDVFAGGAVPAPASAPRVFIKSPDHKFAERRRRWRYYQHQKLCMTSGAHIHRRAHAVVLSFLLPHRRQRRRWRPPRYNNKLGINIPAKATQPPTIDRRGVLTRFMVI